MVSDVPVIRAAFARNAGRAKRGDRMIQKANVTADQDITTPIAGSVNMSS
jgi:hypothetical protein